MFEYIASITWQAWAFWSFFSVIMTLIVLTATGKIQLSKARRIAPKE